MPKHNLLVKNLKAKWNNVNRNVVYMLYEIYYRTKRLRHNLSSQALKEYDLLTDQFVQSQFLANSRRTGGDNQTNHQQQPTNSRPTSTTGHHHDTHRKQHWTTTTSSTTVTNSSNTDPITTTNQTDYKPFEDLLNKLDAERNVSLNVYCDEQSSANHSTSANFNDLLYGPNAIRTSDVVDEHVFIEFINSQIKLSLDESGAAAESVQTSVGELAGGGASSNKSKKPRNGGQTDSANNKPGKKRENFY